MTRWRTLNRRAKRQRQREILRNMPTAALLRKLSDALKAFSESTSKLSNFKFRP